MSDQITDSAPSDVKMEVAALAADLDTVVPAKTNENLLIETWNVRDFDKFTAKRRAVLWDSPGVRMPPSPPCVPESP